MSKITVRYLHKLMSGLLSYLTSNFWHVAIEMCVLYNTSDIAAYLYRTLNSAKNVTIRNLDGLR